MLKKTIKLSISEFLIIRVTPFLLASASVTCILIKFLLVYDCLPLFRLTTEKPLTFESFFHFLTLLKFCHKALTCASLLLIPYNGSDISFISYRTDYSFVTFFGCWAFIWIPVPTLFHQLFPEGWRRLATLLVNWTVTFIHPLKEILKCFSWSVGKGPLSVPHLPHYQPQAVDVCLGVVHSGMKHFRCHVNRCSLKGAGDVYFCFGYAHVSNLDCVFFRQL